MNKEKLKALMKRYSIFEVDIDNICDFCSILMEKRAKELEETEPYATNTIKRYKTAANELMELADYIYEILESEE